MKPLILTTLCAVAVMSGGCALSVETRGDPPQVRSEGLIHSYAAVSGIRAYDGTILRAGVLSSADTSQDLLSLEVWPLGEAGIGLIGARLKLLFLEAGLGILGYKPEPAGPPSPVEVEVDD